METLCPFCANATVHQVAPLVKHPVIGPALTLSYVPWGNAKMGGGGGAPPSCQHGPLECALNTLLSCSVALYPPTWFEFALCLEETVLNATTTTTKTELSPAAVAAKCAPPDQQARLLACADGALGRALARMAADRTAALAPRHEYVPWFVVNGVPLRSAADNLLAFVCVALDPGRRAAARDVCGDPVVEEPQEEGGALATAAVEGRTERRAVAFADEERHAAGLIVAV